MTIQQHASFNTSDAKLNATSKLVKAWESKNAKNAARAGGVSLMALSLVACGGSDDVAVDLTPFAQSDIDSAVATANDAAAATAVTVADAAATAQADAVTAAEAAAAITAAAEQAEAVTAAETAALTAANGTTYATVDAAFTAGSDTNNADAVATALTDAGGTAHATVDAAITSNDTAIADAATTTATAAAEAALVAGTGFDTVAALNSAYTAAIAATPALASDLSTGSENVFGTVNDDVINGTATTYTAGDIITDGTGTDNDTLTVTTTTDIAATPVVSGIENINFVLTSVGGGATAPATFTVDAANINASTVTLSATNASTVVTTAAVTNIKTGVTIASDIATVNVATVADADTTVNATGATQTVVQSGTTDTLTITGGNLTVNDVTAEEAITITATGTVSMTDATANAAGADVAISITAGGDVTVADVTDTGSLTVVSGGDIVVGGTDLFSDGAVTLTTTAGDITVTDADDATSLVINAVGAGPADTTTASDGAVIVSQADAATTATITSTDSITITEMNAATSATLSAAAASSIVSVDGMVDLTLESTSTAATAVVFTVATAGAEMDSIETVTITGSNDVTLAMNGDDLVTAEGASQALVATDNSTGTSRLDINKATGAALDLSDVALDEIEISVDNSTSSLTVATGAQLVVSADQTDLTVTAAAVAGNTLNVQLDSGTVGTGVDVNDIASSNIATLAFTMADDATADHNIDLMTVGASTAVTIGGNGGITIGSLTELQTAASVDASGVTGDVIANVAMNGSFKTGTGDDTINISDALAASTLPSNNRTIDAGDGADSLVFAASDDFSAATLALTGFETLNVAASGVVLAGSQVSGKGYSLVGDLASDTLAINASSGTGEAIDISTSEIVLATVTITGGAGADTLTGSATNATTIAGGVGADTITGGDGADIITGGTGIDTINLGGGAGDDVNYGAVGEMIAADRDVINGFVAGATNSDTVSVTAATVTNSQLTIAGATAASEYVTSTVAQVATAATYDVSAIFDADAAAFLELGAMSSFADLSLATDGSEVMKGLASTSNAATSITIAETNATADTGIYIIAYDNDDAYLYYAKEDNDDDAIIGTEMALIGTFTDVEVGAFTVDNFIV